MLAEASNLATGTWVNAGAAVIGILTAILAVFVTRREVDSHKAETDRRLSVHEEVHKNIFSKVGGVERGAQAKVDQLRSEVSGQISDLHEKVNRVDKNVTAIEVETRLQTRTMTAIAHKLNVTAP
jgi:hypothetical protein